LRSLHCWLGVARLILLGYIERIDDVGCLSHGDSPWRLAGGR
jgi:hypothetical protein